MIPNAINEFIQALDVEIKALKSGKGGTTNRIYNGKFINRYSDYYIYRFTIDSFLNVLEETPAEINIDGQHYKALIFQSQELIIEVGIEHFCGQFIQEATLLTSLWYLLEILKGKYIDCKKGTLNVDFRLSEILFSGKSSDKQNGLQNAKYSTLDIKPNNAQYRAINASFSSQLCIIWGPPGTGKTQTIAWAVEAHISAGRRVLLVSHANNAVDEALEDIAKQMIETSFYKHGQLVRLGKPKDESKFEKCPMVLIDNIKNIQSESLKKKKAELETKKLKLVKIKSKLTEAMEANNELGEYSSELAELRNLISNYNSDIILAQRELKNLNGKISYNEQRLIKAQSAVAITRLLRRLNPEKIQNEIELTKKKILSQELLIKEKNSEINIVNKTLNDKEKQLDICKEKVNSIIKELNISVNNMKMESINIDHQLDDMLKEISQINAQLDEIEKNILSNAKLVATTLTKTFSSSSLANALFDVLILDEASMAPLPFLYWATSRCRSFVTIVGDFLQLPPICISEDSNMAKKWLGRSIFDVLGIDSAKSACMDNRVKLLNEQHRMVPEISEIVNDLFYEGQLKDAPPYPLNNDGVSRKPLVLVDTSKANPWCSKLPKSRFNLYSAVVSASIARRSFESIEKVGIVTPYSPQARLIARIISDWKLDERVRVGNVHNFQGGEADVIIFDCVESPGVDYIAPMIDEDKGKESDAPKLLNVAITRSRQRFYFVGHTKHLQNKLSKGCKLRKILNHLRDNAEVIDSRKLVDSYSADSFDELSETLFSIPSDTQRSLSETESYTEKNFWAKFKQDLKLVRQEIIIFSPFITIKRSGQFMDYFKALAFKGVKIQIHTRPPNQQIGEMQKQSEIVIKQFVSIGVKVTQRSKMHQKVAIFDNHIAWAGSLNILSHSDTQEYMARFEGESAIKDIIKNLEMQDEKADGTITDILCPECGLQMVVRSKYGRKFLGCSGYSKGCKITMKLPYKENELD